MLPDASDARHACGACDAPDAEVTDNTTSDAAEGGAAGNPTFVADKRFECPVCLKNPMPTPIYASCNTGHPLCAECIVKLHEQICPTCRDPLPQQRMRQMVVEQFMEDSYKNMTMQCDICNALVQVNALSDHMKDPAFATEHKHIACPLCNESVLLKQLEMHLNNSCRRMQWVLLSSSPNTLPEYAFDCCVTDTASTNGKIFKFEWTVCGPLYNLVRSYFSRSVEEMTSGAPSSPPMTAFILKFPNPNWAISEGRLLIVLKLIFNLNLHLQVQAYWIGNDISALTTTNCIEVEIESMTRRSHNESSNIFCNPNRWKPTFSRNQTFMKTSQSSLIPIFNTKAASLFEDSVSIMRHPDAADPKPQFREIYPRRTAWNNPGSSTNMTISFYYHH